MDGPLPVALAVLCLVAPAVATPLVSPPASVPVDEDAGRTTATAAPVVREANTTSYLALPANRVETERFDGVRLDVAGAVATDHANLEGHYAVAHLQETFEGPETLAEREAVLNRTAGRLEVRIANLTRRHRQALRDYNAGRISTQAYLRELATIDAAARSLRQAIDQLYTYSRAIGEPVPAARIAQMKARLVPLIGPVRQQVALAMRGELDEPTRVYVQTSQTGVVLAMVQQNDFTTTYVREAFVGAAFDNRFAKSPIEIGEFRRRIEELYPWTATNRLNSDSVLTNSPFYTEAGVYGIAYNHPHGIIHNHDLVTYYDAGTKQVFREIQYKDVSAVPTHRVATATDEGLRVRLYATRGGGPLRVNVTDAATGDPLSATVDVAGSPVDATGPDGELWTIAPRRQFRVTVTAGSRNVSVAANA